MGIFDQSDTIDPPGPGMGESDQGAQKSPDLWAAVRNVLRRLDTVGPRTGILPNAAPGETRKPGQPTSADYALDSQLRTDNARQLFGDIGGNIGTAAKMPYDAMGAVLDLGRTSPEERAQRFGYAPPAPRAPSSADVNALANVGGARAPVTAPMAAPAPRSAARPAGAFPEPGPAHDSDRYEPLMADGTQATAQPAGTPASPVPGKSLVDQFKEAMAAVDKSTPTGLSKEQQDRLRLNFWLSAMANSAKPGARFFGALGEAGQATGKQADDYTRINREQATAALNRNRQDVMNQLTLADKDEDNKRALAQIGVTERHYQSMDKRDQERIGLLARQVAQGKWRPLPNVKSGTYVLYDQETNAIKDTGIKIDTADKRSAEERIVERAMGDPEFLDTMLKLKGKTGDVTESGQFKAAMDLLGKDMASTTAGPRMTPDQAVETVRRTAKALTGPPAQQPLPKGIPPGSVLVGTKNGQPAYRTPDGKFLVVKEPTEGMSLLDRMLHAIRGL